MLFVFGWQVPVRFPAAWERNVQDLARPGVVAVAAAAGNEPLPPVGETMSAVPDGVLVIAGQERGEHVERALEQPLDEVVLPLDNALIRRQQAVGGIGEARVPNVGSRGRVVLRQVGVELAATRASESQISGYEVEPSDRLRTSFTVASRVGRPSACPAPPTPA